MNISYYLVGYDKLDYINKDGRNIKGVKLNIISHIFQDGLGYNLNSFFVKDLSILDKLENLDFDKKIYIINPSFSFINQKIQLKSISDIKPINI